MSAIVAHVPDQAAKARIITDPFQMVALFCSVGLMPRSARHHSDSTSAPDFSKKTASRTCGGYTNRRSLSAKCAPPGPRGLLICIDHRCTHHTAMTADRWPDHVRLSDLEPLFVCRLRPKRRGRAAAF